MKIFEKSQTIGILMTLYKFGEKMYLTQLFDELGHKGSLVVGRLNELNSQGLINDEVEEKFGGRRYIWLTEKGKKVAKHLVDIEKIMEGKNSNK